MHSTVIKVQNLTKKYADTTAVDDISFVVPTNEVIGFLGPNGAGKSTTLKMLTGIVRPTAGSVEVLGCHPQQDAQDLTERIGYLPENAPLYPEMRVIEYLNYRAGIKGIAQRKKAVSQVLKDCQLHKERNQLIGTLSKGTRQRVAIADAIVGNPELLILDEPTSGLDPNQRRDIRALIAELGKTRTVILSSHILPEIEAVCARILIINNGKMVMQGSPEALKRQLSETQLQLRFIDPNNTAETTLAEAGIQIVSCSPIPGSPLLQCTVRDEGPTAEQIFDLAQSRGFKIVEMSPNCRSLEDLFVLMTTKDAKPSKDTK